MKVYCNCCGKEIRMEENMRYALEDYIVIEKNLGGIFQKKDGTRQKMKICESCFDAWVGTFARHPEEVDEYEWL